MKSLTLTKDFKFPECILDIFAFKQIYYGITKNYSLTPLEPFLTHPVNS